MFKIGFNGPELLFRTLHVVYCSKALISVVLCGFSVEMILTV